MVDGEGEFVGVVEVEEDLDGAFAAADVNGVASEYCGEAGESLLSVEEEAGGAEWGVGLGDGEVA